VRQVRNSGGYDVPAPSILDVHRDTALHGQVPYRPRLCKTAHLQSDTSPTHTAYCVEIEKTVGTE